MTERIHIYGSPAQFERADRGVVLMLDPYLGSGAMVQKRPGILRRGRHDGAYDLCGAMEIVECGQLHDFYRSEETDS